MAKVTKRIVDTVVLELDIHEAEVLRAILSRVGGNPATSDRRYADRIREALTDFRDEYGKGIRALPWYDSVKIMHGAYNTIRDHRVRGDIYFYEPGKEVR